MGNGVLVVVGKEEKEEVFDRHLRSMVKRWRTWRVLAGFGSLVNKKSTGGIIYQVLVVTCDSYYIFINLKSMVSERN